MGALCNHSLELTGLAGDPASPVHRLDPRAKIARAGGGHARGRVDAARRLAGLAACAAVLAAVARGARIPAATSGGARASCCRWCCSRALFLPFVRHGGETRTTLGPLTVHEQGLEMFAAVAIKATIGTVERRAARRHHHLPLRAARPRGACACRACSC